MRATRRANPVGQASRLSSTVRRLISARRPLLPGRVSANSGQAGSLSYGSIVVGIGLCFLALVASVRGAGLPLESAGVRSGFSATSLNAQFFQSEAFADWG